MDPSYAVTMKGIFFGDGSKCWLLVERSLVSSKSTNCLKWNLWVLNVTTSNFTKQRRAAWNSMGKHRRMDVPRGRWADRREFRNTGIGDQSSSHQGDSGSLKEIFGIALKMIFVHPFLIPKKKLIVHLDSCCLQFPHEDNFYLAKGSRQVAPGFFGC